jgi:Mg2+ and Co2+ transporter CorA
VITCRVFEDGALKHEIPFDREAIAGTRPEDQRVWIDAIDPTDDELSELKGTLDLHDLAVEDSRKWGQRGKNDFYPQHLFLVAHGINLSQPLVPYFRDVLDHVIRSMELNDNVRDLLTSARELQLAPVSSRLNVVMKKLTAWAAIILIPALIAGIYGMNFKHMPELEWTFGYPLALGFMAASAGLLYWMFRKRDWL